MNMSFVPSEVPDWPDFCPPGFQHGVVHTFISPKVINTALREAIQAGV
jgi:hypothetical protein